MSRYASWRREIVREQPQFHATTYSVCANGSAGVKAYPKSEDAARAMAICAARATGYGAYSVQRAGQVLDVTRFRCDATGDGHVYGQQYSREKFCDVPVIVCAAGTVLP